MKLVTRDIKIYSANLSMLEHHFGPKEGQRLYRKWFHSGHDWIFWNVTYKMVEILKINEDD